MRFALIAMLFMANSVFALDEEASPADKSIPQVSEESPVSIDTQSLVIECQPTMNTFSATVNLKIAVKNESKEEIALKTTDFQLTVDGKDSQRMTGRFSTTKLKSGGTATGDLRFHIQSPTIKEPKLAFSWSHDDLSVDIGLNQLIREKWKVSRQLIGPEKCLAVIDFEEQFDQIAIWVLNDEFKRLKDQGIERVVLDAGAKQKPMSSYALRTTVGSWLSSVQAGQRIQRFPFGAQVQSPVQFQVFHVTGLPANSVRNTYSYPPSKTNIQKDSRERAIADALKTGYSQVPVADVLRDLKHKEAGIRRAAIESNIDRLTERELDDLLKSAESGPPEPLALIVENLHLAPYKSIAGTLARLARHENSLIANAALSSLVQSVSPEAVQHLNTIWNEADDNRQTQAQIVDAVLKAKDYRYGNLLTSHAVQLLSNFSTLQAEAESNTDKQSTEKLNPRRSPSTLTTRAVASPEARTLSRVLDFLSANEDEGFGHIAREKLLQIVDPGIQDVVMSHILKFLTRSDEQLAQAYIVQRLTPPPSTSGLSAEELKELKARLGGRMSERSLVTANVLATIKKFPDPSYTNRVLEISETTRVSSTVRAEAFRVALGCANHRQLRVIISKFDDYGRNERSNLIRHLSAMDHPGWLDLARRCMTSDESTQSVAMSTLQSNGSPEAIQVIADRLEEIRVKAEEDQGLEASAFRIVKRIFQVMQSVNYPEARRIVNRCRRSPILNLNQESASSIRLGHQVFLRSTPYLKKLQEAYNLKKAGKHKESIKAFDDLLQKEPFLASAYVSRASEYMSLGDGQMAWKDLQRAIELNPEDPITESIMAIGMIRIGKIEEGIAESERIMKSIPDLKTPIRRDAIYNTACVYGRASDVTDDEKVKEKYTKRAIELLKKCIHREGGFDDPQHFQADDDLAMFHDHPEWAALHAAVVENKKKVKP